jgi:hypothetical protein
VDKLKSAAYCVAMSDDLTKRRPQVASKVNIHEPYEVAYWKQKFGCTHAQLINTVHAVGVGAHAVENYLKEN